MVKRASPTVWVARTTCDAAVASDDSYTLSRLTPSTQRDECVCRVAAIAYMGGANAIDATASESTDTHLDTRRDAAYI